MNIKTIFGTAMLVAFMLQACGNTQNNTNESALNNDSNTNTTTLVATSPDTNAINANVQNVPQVVTPPPAGANTATTKEGMNPPHGQPGHRCDIPVGAPLNSPVRENAAPSVMPAPTATPMPVQKSQTPNVAPQMPPQQTAPGFSGKPNPEHGKPGHRCDLPVGATLP